MDTSTAADRTTESATHAERLRRRLMLVVVAACLTAALLPLDKAISDALQALRPSGDLRRELELIQQFGSPTTIAAAALLVWRLDPGRFRRLLDWIAAAVLTAVSMWAIKVSLGRPRPRLGEPAPLVGPFGSWPSQPDEPLRSTWRFWTDGASDLWSMPSSHAAAATVAAVVLSRMYPRLTPVVWSLVGVVAFARITLGAHWPSDVVVGAALAYLIADAVVRREVGQRVWRAVFKRR